MPDAPSLDEIQNIKSYHSVAATTLLTINALEQGKDTKGAKKSAVLGIIYAAEHAGLLKTDYNPANKKFEQTILYAGQQLPVETLENYEINFLLALLTFCQKNANLSPTQTYAGGNFLAMARQRHLEKQVEGEKK